MPARLRDPDTRPTLSSWAAVLTGTGCDPHDQRPDLPQHSQGTAMPDKPRSPNHQDEQDVDRLLRKLILDQDDAPPPPRPTSTRPPTPVATLPSPMGVWGRVILGAVLAGALTQWPYAFCDLPLAGYLLGTILVMVTGVWAAHGAWRTRMATAHAFAIGLLFIGAALTAHQVLTRVGYAAVEAAWRCTG